VTFENGTLRWLAGVGAVGTLILAGILVYESAKGDSALPQPTLDHELGCLALNVYWEARSEDRRGQTAIAHLTLNRVADPGFPESICGVVRQGGESRYRCQFHWYCDGLGDEPANPEAWAESARIALDAHEGRSSDPTKGALYFHLKAVSPDWAGELTRTAKIGDHLFYK